QKVSISIDGGIIGLYKIVCCTLRNEDGDIFPYKFSENISTQKGQITILSSIDYFGNIALRGDNPVLTFSELCILLNDGDLNGSAWKSGKLLLSPRR
ncbi:MAG: hypothetical protein EZS28_019146, partial [Streblomastix strix]